jgi:hypothetical protein
MVELDTVSHLRQTNLICVESPCLTSDAAIGQKPHCGHRGRNGEFSIPEK